MKSAEEKMLEVIAILRVLKTGLKVIRDKRYFEELEEHLVPRRKEICFSSDELIAKIPSDCAPVSDAENFLICRLFNGLQTIYFVCTESEDIVFCQKRYESGQFIKISWYSIPSEHLKKEYLARI